MAKKDKFTRLKLIVNPAAGNSAETKRNLNAVIRYLETNGFNVNTAWAKPKAKATPLARKAAKDGYKVVVAMGGDGTVEAVMRGLTGSQARLGIIPTGIQNTIARSLGIPLDLEQACRLISTDNVREMDVAQVKKGKGKWVSFFEMVGIGHASAIVSPQARQEKPEDELFRSQIAASAVQTSLEPKAVLYLDDGRRLELETRLVTVSNMPIFGKKFIVPPPEFLQDDLLDISVFQGFTDFDLYEYYSKVKAGNYAGDENIQHYQSRKVKVKTFPSMDVIADGVELGKGTVSLRMMPGALHVIAARDSRNLLGLSHPAYEHQAGLLPSLDAENDRINN